MKLQGMWETWQDKVKAGLPDFCASPLYVAQEVEPQEVEEVAQWVKENCQIEVWGKDLGKEHGATMFDTKAYGPVTRMWLDSMIETNFLAKHLALGVIDVLDIGAGYGRLGAAMEDRVASYTCTDVVPISRFICEYFTMKYCPGVRVVTPEQVISGARPYTLAINIHSWSEAGIDSIAEWMGVLRKQQVNYLFTVAHDDNYLAWGGGTFRPLVEQEYELVEEAKIGLKKFPHALWRRR